MLKKNVVSANGDVFIYVGCMAFEQHFSMIGTYYKKIISQEWLGRYYSINDLHFANNKVLRA
ncbi:hypothetical protein [Butyrivibrio proteoclasticus]|uniref:hypothetical protein n=1 Tax=Butyrivibrio proteoclasticus TaxID=43305 RepID=UPI00047D854A|nr:hypothetical protein [Butyrivibrio proteoclasticus]